MRRGFEALLLIFAVIGVLQIIVWVADRNLPVHVHFRVIKNIGVMPGGQFQYTNFFTRSKFCETTVERWFVGTDNVIRRVEPLASSMPTIGLNIPQQSEARITVPRDMPAGRSKFCFQSRWICNPLHHIWPIEGPETCIDFIVKPRPISLIIAEPEIITWALEGEP